MIYIITSIGVILVFNLYLLNVISIKGVVMSTIKVMSIIGMVLFPLCFVFASAFAESDVEAAIGWGIIGAMYGLGYSITTFVKLKKESERVAEA